MCLPLENLVLLALPLEYLEPFAHYNLSRTSTHTHACASYANPHSYAHSYPNSQLNGYTCAWCYSDARTDEHT